MKRTLFAMVFVSGLIVGYFTAGFNGTVLAQRPWQCRAWEIDAKAANAGEIGTFLGSASNVQVTATNVASGRYAVVACRN